MSIQFQEKHSFVLKKLNKVPADLFLWHHGDPGKPYLTKIGGLPYRPANVPWPIDESGKPMSFFFQYCFVDSTETLPMHLPGQIMLVFVKDRDCFRELDMREGEDYQIEWWPISITHLMQEQTVPKTDVKSPKYYAEIFKTYHYPESPSVLMDHNVEDIDSGAAFYTGCLISSSANTFQHEFKNVICTFYTNIEALEDATPLDGTSYSAWSNKMKTLFDTVFLFVITCDAGGKCQLHIIRN